ncbi:uncharacterized protein LOC112044277 isoform X2 [Bicyclus anynana]|uniref:Uncharacterized protein LOC112044277 isoform X2 n=1 Tax=Bicyclus anynana TaxID=110368 RepID=A0ABM3LY64_BICAN|nr:uncharacterized protein LOC112044277 isoform X2 [Bicyclus anynana]
MVSWFRDTVIIFFCLSVFVSSMSTGVNKDVIGFPEYEENPLLVNKQNRMPVYLPAKCPENELYYPGDQTDDWICDCRPGFLFHPDTDKCWLAYQQGPCPEEQYLTLPKDSMIPVCVPNPCKTYSMVPWKGQCEKLGSSVCGDTFPAKVLWVNATTSTIDCVKIHINNRFSIDLEIEVTTTCPLGCRRHLHNECTPEIVV